MGQARSEVTKVRTDERDAGGEAYAQADDEERHRRPHERAEPEPDARAQQDGRDQDRAGDRPAGWRAVVRHQADLGASEQAWEAGDRRMRHEP